MLLDNFEKTREKINLELIKRLDENKYNYYNQLTLLKENSFKDEYYIKDDMKFNIENHKEITFTYIENKSIGVNLIGSDLSTLSINNIKLVYNNFKQCIFKNIKFNKSSFYGSEFSQCTFENVEFDECNFYYEDSSMTVFSDNTSFKNCIFKKCNFKKTIFKNISLKSSKFILSNMIDCIISLSYIENISLKDCDCRAFKTINTIIELMEFEDDYLTKFNEDTFIDKMDVYKKGKNFYEKIFKVYKNIGITFESNTLLNNSGEYYYLAKCMERKSLNGFGKIKSYILWLLCGYGERPTYALITSLEILLFFTILYMFTGLDVNGNIVKYDIFFISNLPINNLASDFFYSLYFSIVTFTTVGYGDITPIGASIMLSGFEMILGVTMVGVWTATLARKITR